MEEPTKLTSTSEDIAFENWNRLENKWFTNPFIFFTKGLKPMLAFSIHLSVFVVILSIFLGLILPFCYFFESFGLTITGSVRIFFWTAMVALLVSRVMIHRYRPRVESRLAAPGRIANKLNLGFHKITDLTRSGLNRPVTLLKREFNRSGAAQYFRGSANTPRTAQPEGIKDQPFPEPQNVVRDPGSPGTGVPGNFCP